MSHIDLTEFIILMTFINKFHIDICRLLTFSSCLIGKDPDAGRDWGQEKKGTTEDEMAG